MTWTNDCTINALCVLQTGYSEWTQSHLLNYSLRNESSNHFYCHITTAQVPWGVKFLRACSRQCKKKNMFLHMDSTYLQTVQKTMCKIHIHILRTHKDIFSYQLHIIHRMCTSTLCTHLYIVLCEGATDYTFIKIKIIFWDYLRVLVSLHGKEFGLLGYVYNTIMC